MNWLALQAISLAVLSAMLVVKSLAAMFRDWRETQAAKRKATEWMGGRK
jgi:hypothetical protein